MYQIWRIYLDWWGHDCKKWVWPTFGCKLGQNDPIVMQLKLDMSCHLLNVYAKFQTDISKHVEAKSWKRGRTDGQTDGRTLPRHNTSRFTNGRIKTEHLFYATSSKLELGSRMAKLGQNLFWPLRLWTWPLAFTFCIDITFVNGIYFWKCYDDRIRWTLWKKCDG